jgi:hypothetical protein
VPSVVGAARCVPSIVGAARCVPSVVRVARCVPSVVGVPRYALKVARTDHDHFLIHSNYSFTNIGTSHSSIINTRSWNVPLNQSSSKAKHLSQQVLLHDETNAHKRNKHKITQVNLSSCCDSAATKLLIISTLTLKYVTVITLGIFHPWRQNWIGLVQTEKVSTENGYRVELSFK